MKKTLQNIGLVSVFGAVVIPTAYAQNSVVEEITVTARKRAESALDIPVALTTFSAERLEAIGARGLEDISSFTPGLFFAQQGLLRPGRIDTAVRFRGMSVNTGNPQEQVASVFVDGIYVSGGVQGLGLEDVERVEVIKGPQSGVFGRSTFGGAVNYITRKPGDEFLGKASAELGSYGLYEVSGGVEGPVVPGILSVRVAGRSFHQDGQYNNPAVAGERLGRQNTDAASGTLRFAPSDNFEAIARGFYGHDRDGAPSAWSAGVPEHNCGPFGGTAQTHCGDLPSLAFARIGQNTNNVTTIDRALVRNVTNANFILKPLTRYGLDRKYWRSSLSLEWDIPSIDASLTAIMGINQERKRVLQDGDFNPDLVYTQSFGAKFDDYSQELRLQSDDVSDFDWSVGGNWFRQDYNEQVLGIVNSTANPTNYSPSCTVAPIQCNPARIIRTGADGDLLLGPLVFFAGKIQTRAVFGSLGYDVTDEFKLSGEVRHQWDEVNSGRTTGGTPLLKTFKNLVYRGIADYKPDSDTTIYASISKGNLPGSYNNAVIDAAATVRPVLQAAGAREQVDESTLLNYELGLKGTFLERTLTLSSAAYLMEWRNQKFRRTAIDPVTARTVTYFDTAGRSELSGLELESAWAAAENVTMEATFNYSRGEYKDYQSQDVARIYGNANANGKTLPSFPKYSFTTSATYTGELMGDQSWFVRGDLIYRGKMFVDDVNLATLPASTKVNARVGITWDAITTEIYAQNLLNSKVYPFAGSQADLGAYKPFLDLTKPGWVISLPQKRTFGVRATAQF